MATIHPRNLRVPFEIHHDEMDGSTDEEHHEVEDSKVEEEDDNGDEDLSEMSEDSDAVVDSAAREDIEKFQQSFEGISDRFRLINRIGEGKSIVIYMCYWYSCDTGTFSTVYKAEDLLYDAYDNYWDIEEKENPKWASPPLKKRRMDSMALTDVDDYSQRRRQPKYVAIKKIYVTSSPTRILNELELLADLNGCDSVCPLITAFRHMDQVVAVLPYFRHTDFRSYFRQMTIPDMQIYFRSLFTALAAVHSKKILHRDIKPTNFLYEPTKRRGVLVDFGLAEWEGTDAKPCLCTESAAERRHRVSTSVVAQMGPSNGYPRNDSRPSRRANRAGTRGFRAPEVLMKCTQQTTKIDIWSAGVILLTILSKRFPFFNSADDVEAMIEIATIFGTKRMKACAFLHGTFFETNIPSIGQNGFSFEKLILWSTSRSDGVKGGESRLSDEERLAISFLERCLEIDPNKRISAVEALEHPFLKEEVYTDAEEDEMHIL